jgi:hypothetical protein
MKRLGFTTQWTRRDNIPQTSDPVPKAWGFKSTLSHRPQFRSICQSSFKDRA